jgi:hypothetical protein
VTWTWDGSDWRQQSPAVSPPYHPFTSLAWDAGDNLVLLFGGGDGRTGLLDDTWGWDGSNWHLMHPAHSPPPQVGPAMSDDGRGDVLLFSAENPPQISSAPTWVWHDDDWLPVMPHAGPQQSQPLRRADAALAYDPELSAPVLLGGHLTVPGCDAAGAWAWRGSWASLTPAGLPPRMVDAGAASLPGGGVMLFGGSPGDTVQPTSWTWVLRGTQWTRVT